MKYRQHIPLFIFMCWCVFVFLGVVSKPNPPLWKLVCSSISSAGAIAFFITSLFLAHRKEKEVSKSNTQ
jgi:hypothetical protein